ncbi:MAG: YggS family pyridoxal phosphate-dependent enzyme [Actinomycetes bacterium]
MSRAPGERREELAAGLAAVRQRVETACEKANRDPSELTVVVVTKTFPASDVVLLADLGVRDVGESRDQEAKPKVAECVAAAGPAASLRWHFVGRLQTNKAASVASYAAVVHSVDRPKLVPALSKGAVASERTVQCLLQVSLDADPSRGGALPADVAALGDTVASADGLELRGVMAVAPMHQEPSAAFARLLEVSHRLREQHAQADWVSAGMSGDLEQTVLVGATHLRVGSAVLGSRPRLG